MSMGGRLISTGNANFRWRGARPTHNLSTACKINKIFAVEFDY